MRQFTLKQLFGSISMISVGIAAMVFINHPDRTVGPFRETGWAGYVVTLLQMAMNFAAGAGILFGVLRLLTAEPVRVFVQMCAGAACGGISSLFVLLCVAFWAPDFVRSFPDRALLIVQYGILITAAVLTPITASVIRRQRARRRRGMQEVD